MPMNIMEYTAMVRPRSRSGTIDCISVFDAPICVIIEKPTGTSKQHRQRCTSAKARKQNQRRAEAPQAIATQRPRS